jgi:hypothetical protein
MQFYSGPLMHFLSGVDTASFSATLSPNAGVSAPYRTPSWSQVMSRSLAIPTNMPMPCHG